jgi:N-carbamoyl-L-amino-acid hydrolase
VEKGGIATASGTTISFKHQPNESKPALTENHCRKNCGFAKALGFTYKFMQSGAGHDSQEMANIAPAMIFVPSVGGISHSPKELTKPEIWRMSQMFCCILF